MERYHKDQSRNKLKTEKKNREISENKSQSLKRFKVIDKPLATLIKKKKGPKSIKLKMKKM